jgi:hypothetical protein
VGLRLRTWTEEQAGSERRSFTMFVPRKPQPPITRTVPNDSASMTAAMSGSRIRNFTL